MNILRIVVPSHSYEHYGYLSSQSQKFSIFLYVVFRRTFHMKMQFLEFHGFIQIQARTLLLNDVLFFDEISSLKYSQHIVVLPHATTVTQKLYGNSMCVLMHFRLEKTCLALAIYKTRPLCCDLIFC